MEWRTIEQSKKKRKKKGENRCSYPLHCWWCTTMSATTTTPCFECCIHTVTSEYVWAELTFIYLATPGAKMLLVSSRPGSVLRFLPSLLSLSPYTFECVLCKRDVKILGEKRVVEFAENFASRVRSSSHVITKRAMLFSNENLQLLSTFFGYMTHFFFNRAPSFLSRSLNRQEFFTYIHTFF